MNICKTCNKTLDENNSYKCKYIVKNDIIKIRLVCKSCENIRRKTSNSYKKQHKITKTGLKQLTKEQLEDIKNRCLTNNESPAAIAREFNINRHTLYSFLNKYK